MKDKTASYPRNTVAWMPGIRQAALSSYAVLKHNTIVAERQFLWATFWKFLILKKQKPTILPNYL